MSLNLRTIGIAFVGAVAIVTAAAGVVAQQTPSGPVPPPPPYPGLTPPGANVPIVQPTAQQPRTGRRGAAPKPSGGATDTPPPPQFTNLSGVWEVEAQPGGSQTIYTHLRLQQNADSTITGYWERGKQQLPFNGNFDGRQFKLTVQDGKAQTTFAGYEDNFSDMVGLIDAGNGKPAVPFTASHRKKSEFLNGINIGPGIGGGIPQGH